MPAVRDRRRAQSGTTLVELLVAVAIAGLALALIMGTISTGILESTLAKRNAAVQAIVQYEIEQVSASAFQGSGAQNYSECFSIENPTSSPFVTTTFQGACPDNNYSLRADVTWAWQTPSTVQVWTIAVVDASPAFPQAISKVQVYKVAHR